MIAFVKGSFKKFDATICTNDEHFSEADVDVWIDPASIETGDAKRDAHLKSAEFFDVEKFNIIAFKGRFERSVGEERELWGDLTIKDVSKRVKLDVVFGGIMKDPYGNEKAGFTVSGKIDRKEWGLTWNTPLETGGVMLSDDVIINCDVELIKDKDHKATAGEKRAEEKNVSI